jgi:hypothetical protein
MRAGPIAVALLLTACGTQSASAEPETFREQWEAQLAEAREGASEYELELIADDVVTAAEHEDAIVRHLACIENAGLHVIRLERAPSGMIAALGVAEEEDAAVAECEGEFYDLAREGYRATTLDPDGTEAQRLAALAACLRDAGITEVPADPSSLEAVEEIIAGLPSEGLIGVSDPADVLDGCLLREWY